MNNDDQQRASEASTGASERAAVLTESSARGSESAAVAREESASPQPPLSEPRDEQDIARSTRRALFGAALAAGAGLASWQWLRTRRLDSGIPWPLRRVLETNEQLARDLFSHDSRTREYPFGSAPKNPRVNGLYGLKSELDLSQWKLRASGVAAGDGNATVSLDQIKALPRADLTMRLCCIEGWSIFVNWSGVRFADFLKAYPPRTRSGAAVDLSKPEDLPEYVAMQTPDGAYYVGLDMASAIHPQTLLAYEIDNQPLTIKHGAPLRLVIPTKYGVKNIKRIGTITYTYTRPRDYWAERGYDWYAGL